MFNVSSSISIVPVIMVIFVVLILGGIIASVIQGAKRREALFELAQRLGLNFDAGKDYGLAGRFNFLKQFSSGDDRYATNVLTGSYQQNETLAFDYHYETHSTDSKGNRTTTHHWFSIFILALPAFFPELTIRREGFFTKIAEVFGYQDINFESAEFSKTFNVRSPDRKFAYDVCNVQMMEYLLANRDLNIEIENNALALAFDSRLAPEKIESNLRRLVEIRSLLPGYLFTKI